MNFQTTFEISLRKDNDYGLSLLKRFGFSFVSKKNEARKKIKLKHGRKTTAAHNDKVGEVFSDAVDVGTEHDLC